MQLNSFIAIVGLAFDIAGAYTLAKGIIRKTDDRIRLESTPIAGYSPFLIGSGVTARLEGITGFFLMALGFFLQGIQYFIDYKLEIPSVIVIISVIGVVLFSVLVWTCVKYYILPEAIARSKAPTYTNILTSMPGLNELNRVGDALKLKQLKDETDREYWERLCSKIRRYSKQKR